ncbi:MAG: hypothetical protein V9F04_16385 [Dermatophilaceae bacterium]
MAAPEAVPVVRVVPVDGAQAPTLEPGRFERTASVLLMGPAALAAVGVVALVSSVAGNLVAPKSASPYLMASVQSPWSMLGMTFGAPVLWGGPGGTVFFSPFPLGLAVAVLLVGRWSYRLEQGHPSASGGALLGAAAIPATFAALITMFLAWIGGRESNADSWGVSAGPDLMTAFLSAGLWILVAGLAGRWLVVGSPKLPSGLISASGRARVRGATRSALTHLVLSAVVGSAALAVGLWGDPMASFASVLVTMLWSIPVGGIVVTEYFTGIPLLRSTSGEAIRSASTEVDGVWSSGPAAVVFALLPLAVLLIVGLSHGAMRQRPGRLDALDCLVTGAMFVAVTVPINAYAQLDSGAPIGHLPQLVSGLAVHRLPAALVMFAVGALVPVIGAFLAPRLSGLTARVTSRYAGAPVPIHAAAPAEESTASAVSPATSDSPWHAAGETDHRRGS